MLFQLFVIAIFLTMITVLVAAHELGHYLFARLFKMDVEEFAIGFGKRPILTWMKRKYPVDYRVDPGAKTAEGEFGPSPFPPDEPGTATTYFTVRPLPLGGFVRIKGMMPQEDGGEVNVPGGFYSKPPWQRFVVLFAGPIFSVLAGLALLVPLFCIVGMEKPDNRPILGAVLPGAAADKAGLQRGDRVLSIAGKPIETFYEITVAVGANPDKPIPLVYERKGERRQTTVTPQGMDAPVFDPDLRTTDEIRYQGRLGARIPSMRVDVGIVEATAHAVSLPYQMVSRLLGLFKTPSRFKEEIGGPISIYRMTQATARGGWEDSILLAGLLSMSLGIFNLLPFPPLDGGQMIVALAEMLRGGRRLSLRVQTWVHGLGMALVGLLILAVIANDIGRLLPK